LVEDMAGVVVVAGQAADGLAGGGQAVQLQSREFAQIVDSVKDRRVAIPRPVTAGCVKIGEEAWAEKDRL
jgi:hypothetical protein